MLYHWSRFTDEDTKHVEDISRAWGRTASEWKNENLSGVTSVCGIHAHNLILPVRHFVGCSCLTFLPHLLHSPENSTLLVAQTSYFAFAFHSLANSSHLASLSPTLSAAIITSSAQLLMWCPCSKFFNGSFCQQVKGPNSTSKFIGPLYCGPNLPFHTLPNFLTYSSVKFNFS